MRGSGQRRPGPACVKTCPTGAIHFGTKKEMLEVAEVVAKLKNAVMPTPGFTTRGRQRNPRDVRPASCRPAGAVSQAAEGTADRYQYQSVEGR